MYFFFFLYVSGDAYFVCHLPADICETIVKAAAMYAMHATQWFMAVNARDTVDCDRVYRHGRRRWRDAYRYTYVRPDGQGGAENTRFRPERRGRTSGPRDRGRRVRCTPTENTRHATVENKTHARTKLFSKDRSYVHRLPVGTGERVNVYVCSVRYYYYGVNSVRIS